MSSTTEPPGLPAYCRAMLRHFFTAMSGPLSVPLAVAAFWVENQTVKVLLGLTAFICVWAAAYWIWRPEREAVINLERAATVRDENKQQLLDHISSLRERPGTVRIEMERDVQVGKFSEQDWQSKFNALEN